MLLCIDSKGKVLRESEISKGSVNRSLASVRSIMMEALDAEAVHLILMHNHPSGDPSPSREDIISTRQVSKAGEILGIILTDHIIIGDLSYCSLKEMGLLSDETTKP